VWPYVRKYPVSVRRASKLPHCPNQEGHERRGGDDPETPQLIVSNASVAEGAMNKMRYYIWVVLSYSVRSSGVVHLALPGYLGAHYMGWYGYLLQIQVHSFFSTPRPT